MSVRDDRRLNMSLDEIIHGNPPVFNGEAEGTSSGPPNFMTSNSPLLRNLYPRPAMPGPQRQNNNKNYQRGGFQKAKRSFFDGSRNQLNGGKFNGQRHPYYAPRYSPWESGSSYSGGEGRRGGGGGRSRTPGPSQPSPWEGGGSVCSSEGGGGGASSRPRTPAPSGSGGGPFSTWSTPSASLASADSGGRGSRSRTPGPFNRPRFSRARSCGPPERPKSRRPPVAPPSDWRGSYLSLLSAGSSSTFLQPPSLLQAEDSYTPSQQQSRGREFPGRSNGDYTPSIHKIRLDPSLRDNIASLMASREGRLPCYIPPNFRPTPHLTSRSLNLRFLPLVEYVDLHGLD